MSLFSGKLMEIGGVRYHYTDRMHKKVNDLAGEFYSMHGYRNAEGFQYFDSTHPQEKLMYSMALKAFITCGKIKAL